MERHRAEEKFKEITAAYRRISRTWKDREAAAAGGQKSTEAPEASAPPKEEPLRAKKPTARRPTPPSATSQLRQFLATRFRGMSLRLERRSLTALVLLLLFAAAVAYVFVPEWFGPEPPTPQPGNRFPRTEGTDRIVSSSTGEPAAPQPESSSPLPPALLPPVGPSTDGSFYGIGSTQADVLRVQGPPTRTQGQTWVYGLSDMQFKEGRLWRYNNFDGSLKIRLTPSAVATGEHPAFFTLGSNQNEVLLVQGTPTQFGPQPMALRVQRNTIQGRSG